MNPQPDIQSLIDDINSILSLASGNRLPWSRPVPMDTAKQRRVLERVRDYLLHQQIAASSQMPSEMPIDPRLQQLISQQVRQELQEQVNLQNLDATNYSSNLGGMSLDALENWGQYNSQSLTSRKPSSSFSEIQQQEIMSSFSALMHELQEGLHQQMQQAFTQINSQITQIRSSNPALELSQDVIQPSEVNVELQENSPGVLSSQERWEKMQLLQQQSDQLLLAIDSNQRIIFETLQRHLQTYQQSLTNKLSGMYQLGMQTEVVFTSLVQQLVQQMETELDARQNLASGLVPNLAVPELSPNQGSQADINIGGDIRGEAIALASGLELGRNNTPDPLANQIFTPSSPPALSFSPSSDITPSSSQETNQALISEGLELNWDNLGATTLGASTEADIDALINLNLGLNPEGISTTLPEDIDGILASLNTPVDPFAADKDTIPDGGEELYTSLFSLDLENDSLESALFGEEILEEEILEMDAAIISSPEDVSWEIALFATDASESITLITSLIEEEEPEVIQRLTDLIDPASRPEIPIPIASESTLLVDRADRAEDLVPDLSWGLDSELGSDRYILAAPEESLLVPSPANPETDIALEQDIWMQLDQDLTDFEAGITPTPRLTVSADELASSEDELGLSEVEVEDFPEDLFSNSDIVSPEDFIDRPISDELLAEDWQEAAPLLREDILGEVTEVENIVEVENVAEPREAEGIEESGEVADVLADTLEDSSETDSNNSIAEPREILKSAIPEMMIPGVVVTEVGENIPDSPSLGNHASDFASLDLDAEELASLEGIAIEDAPQSESALIAQLLMDEALDQELEIVKSLEMNSEAELNPEDLELLESFSVESFDKTELEDEAEELFEGLFPEELGISPSLRLSLSPKRLIRSEDDTLTEIPHDEDEPSDPANSDWQDHYVLSESTSEIRFLENGELLVETEANIETNYPLNLDESELMEMVWNQILDRDGMTNQSLENEGQYSPIAEEQENGEYSSQEVLDLEIQDAINEGFPEWGNAPTYLENNLDNNHGIEGLIAATAVQAIAATAAQAIAATGTQAAIANLGSNPTRPVNPDHYQIPQGNPIPITEINAATWYLGVDFGTTSLGAVLLNQTTGELYPLYWQSGEDASLAMTSSSNEWSQSSSLPTGVYGNPQASESAMYPVGLGVPETLTPEQMLCQNFKPYLDLGIPYWTESGWQPILRLAQNQPLVDLHWLQKATQALLSGLSSHTAATQKIRATGIAPEILVNILESIAGVVLNCPTNSSDAYSWNLREAVLAAGLVPQPEQVIFVEEAIAPFLASLQIRYCDASRPTPFPWRGYTLVISSGATATEFALVNANEPHNLTHGDFGLWSFPYAGNAFDQDIICQLLLSPATKIMQNIYETDKLLLAHDLELPMAGELDITSRQRLHFWLQSSAWGQTLLIAAQNLKLHLQTKTEHRLVLGSDQWLVHQDQYESMVVIPFLQQLNQQLNNFLSITGVAEHSIFQVVCAGGTVSGSLLTEWLKIKLPQAVVIQQVGLPVGTMVAAGLASLPLYPQICSQAQQYSDYFLLMELLRILPLDTIDTIAAAGDVAAPNYHLDEINQLLERRGINTRACSDRLLDILRGELPIGLIPQLSQNIWLTTASQQHPEYLALKSAKLFTQDGQNYYQPNLEQCRRLYRYMNAMLDKTQQKLEEPLIFDLGNS